MRKEQRMARVVDGVEPDALLAPISAALPAGADPRENFSPQSRYFRLRDARSEARAAERLADAGSDGDGAAPAQWTPVVQLATELLTVEAKDLEVAAWRGEALLRTDGLPGLAEALRLMRGLIERYWDTLHPMPDEDGLATRLAPIAGLNGEGGEGTLAQPLRKLVLFERRDGSPVALWQYQQSAELAGIGDAVRRAQRIAAGVLPFEQMESEAQAAGASQFAPLRDAAIAARDAWQALSDAMDAHAGGDAPPTSRIRDVLQEIVGICERYAPETPVAVAPQAAAPAQVIAATTPQQRHGIETREDALRILGEVADFFRRTEPHSPLAYTLYEAVRRGRLTWPELLEEIVPDTDSRSSILLSLGIRPVPPEE
jgi:type VI secretion system protein ImpA